MSFTIEVNLSEYIN